MSQIVVATSTLPIPAPRVAAGLSFRLATIADVPAIDALQKNYPKALGRFATSWFEGYIGMGGVLIAEERHEGRPPAARDPSARRHEGRTRAAGWKCVH